MITKRPCSFLLTRQSLHTFSIAQIISGLTITLTIRTHEHLHAAPAPGGGTFCAGHSGNTTDVKGTTTSIHENQLSKKAYVSSHRTLSMSNPGESVTK